MNSKPYTEIMLSEHFSLSEFEKSETAQQFGIENKVPVQYIPVLQQLCRTVLEPLRTFVGGPVIITSGYRCNALNVKVGGTYASQHTLGEAADIRLPQTPYTSWKDGRAHTDLEAAHRWLTFLKDHTNFDQLILETTNGLDYWLHVSCRKNIKKNRRQVLTFKK